MPIEVHQPPKSSHIMILSSNHVPGGIGDLPGAGCCLMVLLTAGGTTVDKSVADKQPLTWLNYYGTAWGRILLFAPWSTLVYY